MNHQTKPTANCRDPFLVLNTVSIQSKPTRFAYAVHEIRDGRTLCRRRVIGIFKSKKLAEQVAAEARSSIERFLVERKGRQFGRSGLLGYTWDYWTTHKKPMRAYAFSVEIEKVAVY